MRANVSLLLLWLVGISLRLTILAVPPLLPVIHRELHLSEALVGALTALPTLLLALAAVPGSLLISRLGARRALALGMVLLAVAGAARGLGSSAIVLFAMTFIMGVGIAVSQPALPSLVKQWEPARVGLATAVFSNGFLIGEILASSLTGPLILPLVHGRWQTALALWSLPILLVAVGVFFAPAATAPVERAHMVWWPNWRESRTWRLGIIFGCASIAYFGANAFIPDYLKATHHGGYISAALATLNIGQLPASFLVGAFADRFIAHKPPLLVAGVLMFVSASLFVMGGVWVVVWAALLGFSTALVFVLLLALPPLLAPANDVHRLSAAIFTLTYACSFLGSYVGGEIWDITRIPITAFVPVAGAGLLLLALLWGLKMTPHPQPLAP